MAMQEIFRKRWLFWAVIFAGLTALGASVWWYQQNVNRTSSRLIQRAELYWDAVRLNDLYTQYTMQAKAEAGELPPDLFEKQSDFNVRVIKYKLGEVRIKDDLGMIEVNKELTMPDFQGKTFKGIPIKDVWTYMHGDWYHGIPYAK